MEEMVRDQEARIEEAFIGYGEWSVAKEYKKFTVCHQTWFKMNEERRKSHIQRFNSAPLQPAKMHPGQSTYDEEPGEIQEAMAIDVPLSDDEADAMPRQLQLPVDAVSSGIVSVPEDILYPMWEKAERILNSQDAVTHAPGIRSNKRSRMVASTSGCHPHFVTTHIPYNGKFICDCKNYKLFAICSRSLVAATVNGALGEFIEWHLGHFSGVNVTEMTTSDQPKGAGRKGRVAPRKRKSAVKQTATCRDFSVSFAQPQAANSAYSESSKQAATTCRDFSVSSAQPQAARNAYPESSGESSRPFFLKMMSPYVRICQGCRTNFKCSDNIIPDPPLDMILGRVEKREIITPSGTKMLKETTSHYHVSMACVKAVCPHFNPQENLFIPSAVKKKLNEVHWYYIQEELNYFDKS